MAIATLPGLALAEERTSKEQSMAEPTREQIDLNYKAFQEKLPELMKTHAGKFALLHDGEVVAFFDSAGDAYFAGTKMFTGGQSFSIQEVVQQPINLGFFSYAVSQH